MELDLFVTPGLGDNSYLLSSGDEAAAIDPQRDVERILDAARARRVRIRYAIETHLHNDYVSGSAELRASSGAEIVGPPGAAFGFGYLPLGDGAELSLGDLRLVALATPGHTPEHTSYLLHDAQGPAALFSGGSLIVGSAGRTDLLGPDRAEELTRAQYRTMRRLADLPDDVALLPTHGAGSFCATAPPGTERTSRLGDERASNPALADLDEDGFVHQQLSGLMAFPAYYAHMAPINRAGPPVYGRVPVPPPVPPDRTAALIGDGAWLVDAREGSAFAAAHIPGSLNVPLEDSFGSYVGWLVPFGSPIVLVVPEEAGLLEAATQLFRIGYEHLEGCLEGGVEAWSAAGREVGSYPTLAIEDLVAELGRGDAG
ncbi:MAG TPA: MBL fold metallo-hydrolase, partial [Actinomycetota bacterium]|nr:MBL fold metallo-hydrolase [Actinomycetota bacterium]